MARWQRAQALRRRDAPFLKRKALMRLRRRFSFLRLVLQRMVTAPGRRLGASAVRGVMKRCVGCPIATLAPPPRVNACARGEQACDACAQREREIEDVGDDERCRRGVRRAPASPSARAAAAGPDASYRWLVLGVGEEA